MSAPHEPASGVDPRSVWAALCDLVLDNLRRRAAADAAQVSFGKVRALRRLAAREMAMGELALALGIDPPNATTLVDELEREGLVRRRPHPSDRRAKLVELTPKGRKRAAKATAVLATPPDSFVALGPDELSTLARIIENARRG